MHEFEEFDPATATVTAFRVEEHDGGVRISWSDDPLDFVWQTKAQIYDLSQKLFCVMTSPAFEPPKNNSAPEL